MKREFCRHILAKFSNMKFYTIPFSGSRVDRRGETERRSGMTKQIVVFRNFAKALKNVKKLAVTILET
jgi:hypothetical protein